MYIGMNSYTPQYNNKIAFGHNKGVEIALEKIQKRLNDDNLEILQAQLQDGIDITDNDFVKKLLNLPDKWKNFLLKITDPTDILKRFREEGSDMNVAKIIHDKNKITHEKLKSIFE